MSSKTPTSILLNPDQSFLAFGYDAEYMYSILAENDSRDDEEQITKEKSNKYYFFQRFKVILHEQVSNETMKWSQMIKQMFMFVCLYVPISLRQLKGHGHYIGRIIFFFSFNLQCIKNRKINFEKNLDQSPLTHRFLGFFLNITIQILFPKTFL